MPTNSTFQAEAVNNYIVNWLRDYAVNAKVKGFVVGISGGDRLCGDLNILRPDGTAYALCGNAHTPGTKPCEPRP